MFNSKPNLWIDTVLLHVFIREMFEFVNFKYHIILSYSTIHGPKYILLKQTHGTAYSNLLKILPALWNIELQRIQGHHITSIWLFKNH